MSLARSLHRRSPLSLFLSVSVLMTSLPPAGVARPTVWSERRGGRGTPVALASALRSLPVPSVVHVSRGPTLASNPTHGAFVDAPGRLGRMEGAPAAGVGSRRVLLVQDVHRNAVAQGRLNELTRALIDEGRTPLLALEGGFGPYDLRRFRDYPGVAALDGVLEGLMARGEISGPLRAGLGDRRHRLHVEGVDDPFLYQANVDAYRRARAIRGDREAAWARARAALDARKSNVESVELQALDRFLVEHRAGRQSLSALVRRLSRVTEPGPTMRAFQTALDAEDRLNLPAVAADQRRLLEALAGELGDGSARDLLDQARSFRAGDVAPGVFYRYLEELSRSVRSALWTPALASYADYLRRVEAVDPVALFEELSEAEWRALVSLSTGPADRALLDDDRTLDLTWKLLRFDLTPSEWRRYEPRRARSSELLGVDLRPFENFYRMAELRNRALADNLLQAMEGRGIDRATLVLGGYHAAEVARRLRSQGVTVQIFTPRVDVVGEDDPLAVFTRARSPLDRLVENRRLFLAPAPVSQGQLSLGIALATASVDGERPPEESIRRLASASVAAQLASVRGRVVSFRNGVRVRLDGEVTKSLSGDWWRWLGDVVRDAGHAVGRWGQIASEFLTRPMGPLEATDRLDEEPLLGKAALAEFFNAMTPATRSRDLRRLRRALAGAERILRRTVVQNDALTPLVGRGGFSRRRLDLLRAFAGFLAQGMGEAEDPLKRVEQILQQFALDPALSRALIEAFEGRFRGAEVLPAAPAGDDFRSVVFRQAFGLVSAVEKTNYFLPRRASLALRFNPQRLDVFQDNPLYPRRPWAVIWVFAPYGVQGVHVRMDKLCRGGLRELNPLRTDLRLKILSEGYALADTQQRKNVDIPRGGSKGAFIADPDRNPGASMLAYVDGMIDLMGPSAAVAPETPANRRDDPLEFGPDEGTAVFPGLVAARALQKGLGAAAWRLMTGKPGLLGGASHMKNDLLPDEASNRVTSQGVMAHAGELLNWIGLGAGPVRLVFTGGLDGDVGSGDIRLAMDRWGDRARILSVTDGWGVVFDPEGLDHRELRRLYDGQLTLAHFDEAKLHAGGFRAAGSDAPVALSGATISRFARSPVVMDPGGASPTSDGGVAVSGAWLQANLIFLVPADVFVPGGGRKDTIHEGNVRWLTDDGRGRPLFRGIVYGANVFTTPGANRALETAGVRVIPDEKANSVGVEVSSRLEVDMNILWDHAEITRDLQRDFIAELLPKLLENAQAKHWALQLALRRQPGRFLTGDDGLSSALSRDILTLKAQLRDASVDVDSSLAGRILRDYFPRVASMERIHDRFTDEQRREILATSAAGTVLYNTGDKAVIDRLATATGVSTAKAALVYMEVALDQDLTGDKRRLYERVHENPSSLEDVVRQVLAREARQQREVSARLRADDDSATPRQMAAESPVRPVPDRDGTGSAFDLPDPSTMGLGEGPEGPWGAVRRRSDVGESTEQARPFANAATALGVLQRYVIAAVRPAPAPAGRVPVLFRVVTAEDVAGLSALLDLHRRVRASSDEDPPWLLLTPSDPSVAERLNLLSLPAGVSVRPVAARDGGGRLIPASLDEDFRQWMRSSGVTSPRVTFSAPPGAVDTAWVDTVSANSPFYESLVDFLRLLLGGITVTLSDLQHLLHTAILTSQSA